MLRKDYRGGNAYFDTYYIYDTEKQRCVGIVEEHCRGVREKYFVGWKFPGNHYHGFPNEAGKTATFRSYDDAVSYICSCDEAVRP